MMFAGFRFEKIDTLFAECDGHLHRLFTERQLLGRGEKVGDHPKFSEGLIGVLNFSAHKSLFLSASIRHQ